MKKLHIVILTVIIIGGALLRLSLLPSTIWSGDSARDLIVSSHILKYKEFPIVGHAASGTNPMFYYPPVYYYLLALLQIPSTSIAYVLTFLVLFNMVGIMSFYNTVKLLSDKNCALIATFLFTLSSFYLSRQTTLTSMSFTLPIFLTGTFFHLRGTLKISVIDTIIGYSLLIISSAINYAALILLPIYFFWTVLFFRKRVIKILSIGLFNVIYFIALFYGFISHVIHINGINYVITPFSPTHNIQFHNYFHSIFAQFYFAISIIFPVYTKLIIALFLLSIFVDIYTTRRPSYVLNYPMSIIGMTIILAGMKNVPVATHYYYLALPFFYMIISALFYRQNRMMFQTLNILLIILLCISGLNIRSNIWARTKSLHQASKIVDDIDIDIDINESVGEIDHEKSYKIIALHSSNQDGESLRFAYFAEKKFGKLYTVSNESFYSLDWDGKEDHLAVICLTDDTTDINFCKTKIVEMYPRAVFIRRIHTSSTYPIMLYSNNIESPSEQSKLVL